MDKTVFLVTQTLSFGGFEKSDNVIGIFSNEIDADQWIDRHRDFTNDIGGCFNVIEIELDELVGQ